MCLKLELLDLGGLLGLGHQGLTCLCHQRCELLPVSVAPHGWEEVKQSQSCKQPVVQEPKRNSRAGLQAAGPRSGAETTARSPAEAPFCCKPAFERHTTYHRWMRSGRHRSHSPQVQAAPIAGEARSPAAGTKFRTITHGRQRPVTLILCAARIERPGGAYCSTAVVLRELCKFEAGSRHKVKWIKFYCTHG